MSRLNWKRVRPNSLSHAMELCIKYAEQRNNLSVDRIADRMGLSQKWTLYKWIANGRIPATMIPSFEHASGATYVTTYLATAAHKLLIDTPVGKCANDTDILELNAMMTDAISLLSRFYRGRVNTNETISAITNSIESMAYHRENIQKCQSPELDLFREGSYD